MIDNKRFIHNKKIVRIKQIAVLMTSLFLTVVSVFTHAQNLTFSPSVKVVTEILPPYQIADEHGQATGFAVDFVRKILEEAKLTTQITVYPWARTYKLAKEQKNVVIFSLARIPERENSFHWIGEIHNESYTLLKLKSHNIKMNSDEEAKQYSIAVSRASVGDVLLTELGFEKLERTSGFDQSVKMLTNGRVDLLISSDYALKHSIEHKELINDEMVVAYEIKTKSAGLYLAVSQNSDESLIDALRKAYKKISSTGELKRLKEHWNI